MDPSWRIRYPPTVGLAWHVIRYRIYILGLCEQWIISFSFSTDPNHCMCKGRKALECSFWPGIRHQVEVTTLLGSQNDKGFTVEFTTLDTNCSWHCRYLHSLTHFFQRWSPLPFSKPYILIKKRKSVNMSLVVPASLSTVEINRWNLFVGSREHGSGLVSNGPVCCGTLIIIIFVLLLYQITYFSIL